MVKNESVSSGLIGDINVVGIKFNVARRAMNIVEPRSKRRLLKAHGECMQVFSVYAI